MRWSAAATVCLALAACRPQGEHTGPVQVAQVGQVPIYADALWAELKRSRAEHPSGAGPTHLPASGTREHSRQVLQDLIDRQLVVQQADRQQVSVSSDELAAAVARLRAGWPQDQLEAALAQEDWDLAGLQAAVREALLVRKYMRDFVFARLAITDAQIEAHLAAHPEQMLRPEQIRLAQIVVATQAEATQIAQAVRRGQPFGEAARKSSLAPEGKRGGDLGVVPRGVLPEAFERVCFALPTHTPSPPVHSPPGFAEGYHVFWISEHTMPQQLSVAQVRDVVQQQLRQQAESRAQAEHVAELREKTPIRVMEEHLVDPNG